VTGLPPGATATFTPATILVGSGSTPVRLVVPTTIPTTGLLLVQTPVRLGPLGNAPLGFALLFLPILALHAFRKRLCLATSTRAVVLLATLAVAAAVGFSGCTGTTSARGTSYPLVVTATSGTLHTSFNMTLIVQK
jgi:hypothetical protein